MKRIAHMVSRASLSVGLLFVICLVLIPASLQAGGLGEDEVRATVETWMRYVAADARPELP